MKYASLASRVHVFFFIYFLFVFFSFLSPDFHELWPSMRSTRLITDVKQQSDTEFTFSRQAFIKSSAILVADGFASCTCKHFSALLFYKYSYFQKL